MDAIHLVHEHQIRTECGRTGTALGESAGGPAGGANPADEAARAALAEGLGSQFEMSLRAEIKLRLKGLAYTKRLAANGSQQCRTSYGHETGPSVNKEAQLTTMLIVGFAVAVFGWALVYLASSPSSPEQEPACHREPIPKVVRRYAASIAESPRLTQP